MLATTPFAPCEIVPIICGATNTLTSRELERHTSNLFPFNLLSDLADSRSKGEGSSG